MIKIELTQDELALIERLFNQVSGIDNMRAIIPIHDKMIAAARAAAAPNLAEKDGSAASAALMETRP